MACSVADAWHLIGVSYITRYWRNVAKAEKLGLQLSFIDQPIQALLSILLQRGLRVGIFFPDP